jgi:hypothetical protein
VAAFYGHVTRRRRSLKPWLPRLVPFESLAWPKARQAIPRERFCLIGVMALMFASCSLPPPALMIETRAPGAIQLYDHSFSGGILSKIEEATRRVVNRAAIALRITVTTLLEKLLRRLRWWISPRSRLHAALLL